MGSPLNVFHGFPGQQLLVVPYVNYNEMLNDPKYKELYIHSLGYYPDAKYHFTDRPDGCQEYIFIYCIKGEGWFELDGEKMEVIENQCFILPPNSAHRYGANNNNPWSIYWVHFNGEKAGYLSTPFVKPVNIITRIEDRINLFNDIYKTLIQGFNDDNLYYSTLTLGHFLGLFKFLSGESINEKNGFGTNIVHLATHFMNENINKQLKLKDLAIFASYSPSQFYRLFLKATGYSPIQYFLNLKIERACYYLLNTNYKINQIAKILGIKDAYYFSKLFTKTKRISPSEYRKQGILKQNNIPS